MLQQLIITSFFNIPHYFPTRRSSDLRRRAWRRYGAASCPVGGDRAPDATRRVRRSRHPFASPGRLRPPGASARRRSEEHTSELQSHHDLVCRLLLVKKNK